MMPSGTSSPGPCLPLELISSPVIVLGRLGYEIKRHAIEALEEAGASLYHYSVLALLAEGASETQASIADTLKLDRSQLVGLLDSLEEDGLIERRRDPNDRRRHMVRLTAAGEKRLGLLRSLVKEIEDHFLAPLDADERYQLYRLLFRVAAYHDTRFVRPAEEAHAVT
jgi:MarR family transcriptional regulator, lower aerobic nicotinate degradation pathway regulator